MIATNGLRMRKLDRAVSSFVTHQSCFADIECHFDQLSDWTIATTSNKSSASVAQSCWHKILYQICWKSDPRIRLAVDFDRHHKAAQTNYQCCGSMFSTSAWLCKHTSRLDITPGVFWHVCAFFNWPDIYTMYKIANGGLLDWTLAALLKLHDHSSMTAGVQGAVPKLSCLPLRAGILFPIFLTTKSLILIFNDLLPFPDQCLQKKYYGGRKIRPRVEPVPCHTQPLQLYFVIWG